MVEFEDASSVASPLLSDEMEGEFEAFFLDVSAFEHYLLVEHISILVVTAWNLPREQTAVVLDLHLAGELNAHPDCEDGEMIVVTRLAVHYNDIGE